MISPCTGTNDTKLLMTRLSSQNWAASSDLINVYKYLKGGGRQKDEARLFSVMNSNRMRSNGLKLEHRKFDTNMQKNFYTCVTYCIEPDLAEGLDSMIYWGSFLPLQFGDSMILLSIPAPRNNFLLMVYQLRKYRLSCA